MENEALPLGNLLRIGDVKKRTGMSKSTIYRLIREEGSFPAPILVSHRISTWVESEIDDYIQSKIEEARS